ncbi:MAG TPA: alcohol dehydrogenase catalytic domain-containing protein [Actinophytocola sp.]|uniref:alcohol dehydrogenase catalytic domain-containing protein n=1 Tax=Actinophytocola sp. TaxID=1872138 RepID=UPI002F956344
MKAVVIPGVSAGWVLQDVPTPQPGPGEVLLRVRACGICGNDVAAGQGKLPFPSFAPAIPGHEPVGEVVAVGAGVTSRAVGDRLGTTWIRGTCGRCDYCRLGRPVSGTAAILCAAPVSTGFTVQGGQAEYLVVAADQTVRIPDALSDELAAPVLCAGYTGWSAIRAADPKPHERVAVAGIGAVGHLAVQFAKACGFETVAITSSPDKHEIARSLGADLVVTDGRRLREVGGADVIVTTSPSYAAAAETLAGLRVGGRLVLAGIDVQDAFAIPAAHPFFALDQKILGATHNGAGFLREALDIVASGRVTPLVQTFAKEDIAAAVARVDKGEVRFRAVVRY